MFVTETGFHYVASADFKLTGLLTTECVSHFIFLKSSYGPLACCWSHFRFKDVQSQMWSIGLFPLNVHCMESRQQVALEIEANCLDSASWNSELVIRLFLFPAPGGTDWLQRIPCVLHSSHWRYWQCGGTGRHTLLHVTFSSWEA